MPFGHTIHYEPNGLLVSVSGHAITRIQWWHRLAQLKTPNEKEAALMICDLYIGAEMLKLSLGEQIRQIYVHGYRDATKWRSGPWDMIARINGESIAILTVYPWRPLKN